LEEKMVTLKNWLLATSLFAFAGSAQAVIIDFVDLAEGSLGESGWSALIIPETGFTVNITAKKGDAAAFAYLDYGHAGLGVCGLLDSGKGGFQAEGSKANVCNPSSDDNVTGLIGSVVESLIFDFSVDVIVNKIWFNNTHDSDRHIGGTYGDAGDLVDIDGTAVPGPGNGYANTSNQYNTNGNYYSAEANHVMSELVRSSLTIAFNNQQFYVSAIEVTPGGGGSDIPAPGVLSLLGLGLLGLGYTRRRKA
jgi:hypothetical protein